MSEHFTVEWLGTVRYGEALERQLAAIEERRRGGADRLLLLEHPCVITLGRSARPEHLRRSRAELAARGVELFEVARGGDVTWHGPGQLVGYLIADLAARGSPDVHAWLRRIEGALIEALGALGLAARDHAGWSTKKPRRSLCHSPTRYGGEFSWRSSDWASSALSRRAAPRRKGHR